MPAQPCRLRNKITVSTATMSPDPYKSIAVAVIIQAVQDARKDPGAREWLVDMQGGINLLELMDIEPSQDFFEWVMSGCPKRAGGIFVKQFNKRN